ncbi:hypothetical protein Tco_1575969 [Tanacetum coccineum]
MRELASHGYVVHNVTYGFMEFYGLGKGWEGLEHHKGKGLCPDGKCGAQNTLYGVLGELMHYFDQAFNSFDFEEKCGAHRVLSVNQGKQPGAKSGRKRKSTSSSTKHNPFSAKDSNPIQPLTSTLVVVELHKEDLQATSGSTSLGVTIEVRANPQLSSTNPHVLVDKTKSASEGLETVLNEPETEKDASNAEREVSFRDDEFNTSPDLSSSDDVKKEIKLEDMWRLISWTWTHLKMIHPSLFKMKIGKKFMLKSTRLLLLQTLNSKLVKEKDAAKIEASLLKAKPPFPNVEQLTQLLVNSFKHELSKLLSSHDFSNSLPTELKELPSKFKDITRDNIELKKYWELPAEFLVVPGQVLSIQAKIKTFDALPSLLTKVTEALDSRTNQEQKKIEESVKANLAKKEEVVGKEELIDLLEGHSKESHCDVLTRKGPITLKVYREDQTNKVILNFKAIDLHLAEWREDPLDKLNDLARKKRKHVDYIHDYFRSTKRQHFITIADFRDLINEMLYIVQEIFFNLHQGPGLDDHVRTFSFSYLLKLTKGT